MVDQEIIEEMVDKVKNNWAFIVLGIAVIAILLNLKQCNDKKTADEKAIKFDQSIAAINDTLRKVRNAQGDSVFIKRAVEYSLSELVKSESFKSLSEDNKKFYQELTKVKGLIASSQATISSQAEIIKSLAYDKGTVVTATQICFTKGSTKVIEDTTKALHYKHTLTFGDKLGSDFKYTYKAQIQTSFIRNKDKTITVEYNLGDPNANVTNGQAFIIPIEETTKFQKFLEKNSQWIYGIGAGILFSSGGYVGYRMAK